ncbi:MAG: hypothetical protein R3A80_12590 [Bdellovibrionota bacterium]
MTGVKVEVTDDGTVNLAGSDPDAVAKALEMVKALTAEPEIGKNLHGYCREDCRLRRFCRNYARNNRSLSYF